ncbi:MAG: glycosyltransferase family 25 protein [Proteobacteria bacterium]|nr:glycosyltransferase family 25 protein [Pseudomonadota bacterium]
MKTCVYINLAAAADRRASLEASFAAAQTDGWTLERFAALGPADIADLPGKLSPPEKACFASHRAALARHLVGDDPVMIVEDDAVFAPQAFGVLDALLAAEPTWDVLYGEVVCDFYQMVQLAGRRDEMVAKSQYQAMPLAGRPYFAASAYVVSGSAKRRLHAALSAPAALDQAFDVALRALTAQFRMAVAFPFVTTVSRHADGSQVQARENPVFDATLNAFRRLMYVDRDLDQCRADIERLQKAAAGSDTARLTGALFGVMATPAFGAQG